MQAMMLSDRMPMSARDSGTPKDADVAAAAAEERRVATEGSNGASPAASTSRAGKSEGTDAAAGSRPATQAAPAPEAAAEVTPTLITDFQCAVDFARAAYGYAFLAGGMSSIYRYLHMQARCLLPATCGLPLPHIFQRRTLSAPRRDVRVSRVRERGASAAVVS